MPAKGRKEEMEIRKGDGFKEVYTWKAGAFLGHKPGDVIERFWFVKGAGAKEVKFEYTDSDSPFFRDWVAERSGLGSRISREDFERLVNRPEVVRV